MPRPKSDETYVAPFSGVQKRLAAWICRSWGEKCFKNPKERVARLLEEAVELAQAEDLDSAVIHAVVEHVLSRPPGDPKQEIGGVAICAFAYAEAKGWNLALVMHEEEDRCMTLPVERLRASWARKARAGIAPAAMKEAAE